jgi:glutathione S-transferase
MSHTCRLTYFEGWGLAEQARWMLAASDIAFEQIALQEHADFAALRDSGALMFRQLPLVEIDGLKLVQSQVRAGPQRDHTLRS